MEEEERRELERILGHRFLDPRHLERALTHRSHRQGAVDLDNERLEFLGDRVLGLVASEALFSCFPDWDAGKLSKGLARLVNATSIYTAAQRLDLGRHLRIGPGEEKTGGREKKRLLADAYEAITGAIYQDAGLSAAADFLLHSLIHPALASEAAEGLERPDHKSALQEWLQQRGLEAVVYHLRGASGPEHRKQFAVEVWHQGRTLAEAEGSSKKEAEQSAAKLALEILVVGCESV
jgi:ribonuclease-3